MYHLKESVLGFFIIHTESGVSFPYLRKFTSGDYDDIPEYKRSYFWPWLLKTDSGRAKYYKKLMKEKKKKEMIEEFNSGFLHPMSTSLTGLTLNVTAVDDQFHCANIIGNYISYEELETNKKENAMKSVPCYYKPDQYNTVSSTITVSDENADKRAYLLSRLYNENDLKETKLRQEYGLSDDTCPLTVTDVIKRIQDGLFTIPEMHKDSRGNFLLYTIRWRDPAKKEDKVGFEKANEKLEEEYKNAKDTINIVDPVDGLKVFQAFKAATFQ